MRLFSVMIVLGLAATTGLAQEQVTPPAPVQEQAAPPAPQVNTRLSFFAKGQGQPLAKVEVKWQGQTYFSDPTGNVDVVIEPGAAGKLQIYKKGFEREELDAATFQGANGFDIYLYPAVGGDDVIVVRGTRKPAISRKVVSIQEAAKVAPNGDPAQVVKLLPGVQSQDFGGEVVVRGSGPQSSLYYVDDLEVPFIFHFFNLSLIPGAYLSDVEFESGGFGPEYGDATGGVVVLRTQQEIPERPRTSYVVNVPIYSGIYHTRPLSENSALTVSLRRSYIDFFLQKLIDAQTKKNHQPSVVVSPYFSDGLVSYLKKDERGFTKFTVLGAYDGLKLVVPSDMSSNSDGTLSLNMLNSFINLGVERQTRLADDWRYSATPQVYYALFDNDFFGNKIQLNIYKTRMPVEFTKRLSKLEDWTIGLDPAYTYVKAKLFTIIPKFDDPTWDFEDAEKVSVSPIEKFASLGLWTSVDQAMGNLIASPGLRVFHTEQIKKTAFDPRLRLRYLVSENHTIKGAVGQYSESPEPQEASQSIGNPDLKFTRAMHYILGLETKWDEFWTTELQVFHKNIYDLVGSDNVKTYANKGQARSSGFEAFVRRNLTSRLFGWLSYTYSRTEEQDAPNQAFHRAQYDQTHILNLATSYRLTNMWELGGRFKYNTGSTFSTVSEAVYNADLDKFQPRSTTADQYAQRLPDDKTLTIYATKDFLYDRSKLALKFGLESYWIKPKVASRQYSYDYTKTNDVASLTSVPFLELQGEF